MTSVLSIVMTMVRADCDDKGMEYFDDRHHGALR